MILFHKQLPPKTNSLESLVRDGSLLFGCFEAVITQFWFILQQDWIAPLGIYGNIS